MNFVRRLVVFIAFLSTTVANADPIIFETPEASVDLFGPSLSARQWLGMAFSLDQSYTVTAVSALGMNNSEDDGGNTMHAVVYRYAGGLPLAESNNLVGEELFSMQFATPYCCGTFTAGPTDLSWDLGIGDYFLTFEVRSDDDFQGSIYSDRAELPTMLVNNIDGGNWRALNETIGVRIEGVHQVPEPGTLVLLGIGLFGMAFMRRQQA